MEVSLELLLPRRGVGHFILGADSRRSAEKHSETTHSSVCWDASSVLTPRGVGYRHMPQHIHAILNIRFKTCIKLTQAQGKLNHLEDSKPKSTSGCGAREWLENASVFC